MFQNAPLVALGEFDSIEGPKVFFASEYYVYQKSRKNCFQVSQLGSMHGAVLLSSHVASGTLSPWYTEILNGVIARVLAANESYEVSILLSDSNVGGVAGVEFCLGDILARGEKRRFCLVVCHPQKEELVYRWPLFYCCVKTILDYWVSVARDRLVLEYSTLPELERRREEARDNPMRPMFSLLAVNSETDEEVVSRTHNFFQYALPAVFGKSHLAYNELSQNTLTINSLEKYLSQFPSSVSKIQVDLLHSSNIVKSLSSGGNKSMSIVPEHLVKPLSFWLIQFASEHCSWVHKVELLLSAFLSGNQVIIYGSDVNQSSSLAVSLSLVLPKPLRSVTTFSVKYLPPNECRVLSFSHPVSKKDLIDIFHQNNFFVLFPCTVFVETDAMGYITSICDCCGMEGGRFENVQRELLNTGPPASSVVMHITDLLKSFISMELTVPVYKIIQMHIEQLISDSIMRGQLHNRSCVLQICHTNEVQRNLPEEGVAPRSFIHKLRHRFKLMFSRHSEEPPRASLEPFYWRHDSSVGGGWLFLKPLKQVDLDPLMVSSADNAVLSFLGGAFTVS
ncbi:hypothetical protein TRVL_06104 [Trypanosoma vivax]|nr:hypothetical protein TRVL_06104 [Trypanosoma vivax]